MSASVGQCKIEIMISSHQHGAADRFRVFTLSFRILHDRFDKIGITDGFRLKHLLYRPPATSQSVSYSVKVGRQSIPIKARRTYRTLHIEHRTSQHIAAHCTLSTGQ